MLRKNRKEDIPERLNPGDAEPEYCSPGSIEQELDMCENGPLRGDEILHHHGRDARDSSNRLRSVDESMEERFVGDMSEDDREGDEMSGDDHSSGLQGGEPELRSQPHIDSGVPGGDLSKDAGNPDQADQIIENLPLQEGEKIRKLRRVS